MRQMPSVTDTTVPWVRMRAPASRFWMRLLISSEISEGLSCMNFSLAFQRGLERAELRTRRAVDHLVAEHDSHPGDKLFVHLEFCFYFAAGLLLQPLHQVGELRNRKLERRVHLGLEHALALVLQRLELLADLRQQAEAAVLGQHAHEVLRLAVQPTGEDRDEQARDLGVRHV